jgi:hypothetical protein
LKEELGMTGYF